MSTVTRRAALAIVPALLAAAVARGDGGLDPQIQAALAAPGDPVQAGVWFGAPTGDPLYQRAAGR